MKYKSLSFLSLSLLIVIITSCTSIKTEKEKMVLFTTSLGEIKVKLYNDTPGHRDNFIKLVKDKYYDSIRFHRVISDFMIQTGDISTKSNITEEITEHYSYTIPAEIKSHHFHKKGVIASARWGDSENPERRSSGTQFYFVQGKQLTEEDLTLIEKRVNANLQQGIFYKHLMAERKRNANEGITMSDAEIQEFATIVAYDEINEMVPFIISSDHRAIYDTLGGTPHLDMQYTVFGEVIEGIDVIDLIASVETNNRDKPLDDVVIIKARLVRK
ncbi:MAG: peptidylprolyl isomerase [Bacteroidales bacterium]|nr:peptidylprolyl isomerase [Bacteroidales bacterium]